MKIASDEQRELIREVATEVIKKEYDLDSNDLNTIVSKSLSIYESILNQEDLSVTEQHGVIVAVLTRMILENKFLKISLDCQNKG